MSKPSLRYWKEYEELLVHGNKSEFDLDSEPMSKYIQYLIEAILFFWICGGNLLVIMAYLKHSPLRTVTNFFIVQLSIADFIIGCMMPQQIAVTQLTLFTMRGFFVSALSNALICTSMLMSLSLLVAVTIDRYIAIIWPLQYPKIMDLRKAKTISISLWCGVIIIVLIAIIEWKVFMDSGGYLYCIGEAENPRILHYTYGPVGIMICMFLTVAYIRILHVVKQQSRRTENHPIPNNNTTDNFKINLRVLKTAIIVIGFFLICWLPLFIVIIFQVYGFQFYSALQNEAQDNIRLFCFILAVFNSGFNPIVYALRLKEFKHGFKKVLRIRSE
ncbi:unnamed protein product [Owenia fusiformis]|uniref:G-protein coupled receptors family 1 profile domain-containing protein n=1 Tax=Owenia fusiformis TaxID=6347 RepID=A0A8S4P5F1_OWEFU|nr:unnamed protein product [Owenia fusiformis]